MLASIEFRDRYAKQSIPIIIGRSDNDQSPHSLLAKKPNETLPTSSMHVVMSRQEFESKCPGKNLICFEERKKEEKNKKRVEAEARWKGETRFYTTIQVPSTITVAVSLLF